MHRAGYAGLIERFDLARPIIAAVNGAALGGGFELVLACDIMLAAESASFGCLRRAWGAVALSGGIHRLVRQIREKQAIAMLLTSRRVDAEEELCLGFVNAVIAPGALSALVQAWVDDILKGPPLAI